MSLRLRFSNLLWLSFTAVSLALYLVGCLIILAFQGHQSRLDLRYLLYSEAEALASYIASTGRLDFPELAHFDQDTPAPVWLRVLRGDQLVASTPGAPELADPLPTLRLGELQLVQARSGEELALVEHDVWNQPGLMVQAMTQPRVFARRFRSLLAQLLLTSGLVLAPISAIVGQLLARLILRPVQQLVTSIGDLDPGDLSRRLAVASPVIEIEALAGEFNGLLERVESTVGRMERFTANASHELRTPIASLRAGIEVFLRRPRQPAEYEQLLAELLQEIERMHRSVEGLLALARERLRDDQSSPRVPLVLSEVVAAAERTVAALLKGRELRLDQRIEPGLVVEGNEAQLQLMLINLLDNAIKHSPTGGEVTVEVSRRDGHARLMVADQGPGVPAEDRPFIFERHFQGGGVPASSRVGGIGLDLVRWVVDSHGGSVRLLEGGSGARFEVLLPLAPAEA